MKRLRWRRRRRKQRRRRRWVWRRWDRGRSGRHQRCGRRIWRRVASSVHCTYADRAVSKRDVASTQRRVLRVLRFLWAASVPYDRRRWSWRWLAWKRRGRPWQWRLWRWRRVRGPGRWKRRLNGIESRAAQTLRLLSILVIKCSIERVEGRDDARLEELERVEAESSDFLTLCRATASVDVVGRHMMRNYVLYVLVRTCLVKTPEQRNACRWKLGDAGRSETDG